MALDERILDDVEAAQAALEDLEDRAYEARATVHQAIRRLHAAGGSMREIAAALGMSHQRVHQIIGADGIVEVEATSTEVAPLRSAAPSAGVAVAVTAGEDVCSFCGAPRRDLEKLLAAPGPVFICSRCVGRVTATLGGAPVEGLRSVPVEDDATCSFCGNPSAVGGAMAETESGQPRICRRCVETCRRLVAAEEPPKTVLRRTGRLRCSFCNVSQTDTRKLIAGPAVHICGDCVAASAEVLVRDEPVRGPRQVVLRPALVDGHACSFCSQPAAKAKAMVRGGRGRICDTCLDLCEHILAEDAASSS